MAWALASQNQDDLEGMSLETDTHLAGEVRENFRQLQEKLSELRTRLIPLDSEQFPYLPLDLPGNSQQRPTAANRRRKTKIGKKQEEVPEIFLGAISLSASLPVGCQEECLPILDLAVFNPVANAPTPAEALAAPPKDWFYHWLDNTLPSVL